MSAASDLIERAERESGQRVDDPNSNALFVLLGALSRELGQHSFPEKDDFAVGVLIKDQIENGEKHKQQQDALTALLSLGFSPDDIGKLWK